MNLLGQYTNGNYQITIYDDGTKIRETEDDIFISEFPESIDIKITDQCEMGCPYCHENSTTDGLHGDIMQSAFIDTLLPYTELALGGGNPLSHPQLMPFLQMLREKKMIPNITVHQKHFMQNLDWIRQLADEKLVYGIGVSVTKPYPELIERLKEFPNAVLHVINGVISKETMDMLADQGLKVLILGYKQFRRGEKYYSKTVEKNMGDLSSHLLDYFRKFKVVSFDNLAIRQFNLQSRLSPKIWERFYMGDDGQFTMYIDMVKREFAKSSTTPHRFALTDNIAEMFDTVKQGAMAEVLN